MVQCSFCLTTKSQKYLYAECQHFVCLNCASLRGGQTLKCCNKITNLDQKVKNELKIKKQTILANLQKGYEYEVNQSDLKGFEQIQQKLRKINSDDENKNRRSQTIVTHEQKMPSRQNYHQQMMQTPIDGLYRNHLLLQDETILNTPIKLVTNIQGQNEQVNLIKMHKAEPYNARLQIIDRRPSQINKVQMKLQKNHFVSILQDKIQSIRAQFKYLYEELQKKEANAIYQLKVYFEEYTKLLQTQNHFQFSSSSQILAEQQRIRQFLEKSAQKWNLKQISDILKSQCIPNVQFIQKDTNNERFISTQNNNLSLFPKQKQILRDLCNFQSIERTQEGKCYEDKLDFQIKMAIKNNFSSRPNDFQKQKFDLRLFNSAQNMETPIQSLSTGRNLDKIYRKLEESRSKLQQRIHRHNWFISDRCQALTKI